MKLSLSLPPMALLLTSFLIKGWQTHSPPHVVISPDKMNVFYIGVDNPISVALSGVPIESTKISIDKGIINPKNEIGKFLVQVNEVGRTTIRLEGVNQQGKRVTSAHSFRVKRLPDPSPRIRPSLSGHFGTRSYKALRGLIAILEDFDFDARFNVLSYQVQYVRDGEFVQTFQNEGSPFSQEIRATLKDARIGDIYFFDNIRVQGPDDKVRILESISFKIREL